MGGVQKLLVGAVADSSKVAECGFAVRSWRSVSQRLKH